MIERISISSPMPQSGHESLANRNEQCLSGTRANVRLSVPLVSFLKEQYLFSNETFVLAAPVAIFSIAFLSS